MVNTTTLYSSINELINARKNRLLLLAQSSLPEHQYLAFKTLLLDELGNRGLDGDLKRLFKKQHGMDRNGRE